MDKDIDEPENQVFLLQRCSAIYTFVSAVLLEKDVTNSKIFIDIANNLLFKSTELLVIDFNHKFENAEKISGILKYMSKMVKKIGLEIILISKDPIYPKTC